MTFFPIKLEALFLFWDYILIKEHPSTFHFLALAILEFWRGDLLKLQNPAQFLRELKISQIQAIELVKLAEIFDQTTPNSFKEQSSIVAFQTEDFNSWLKDSVKNFPCLTVSVEEYLILDNQVYNFIIQSTFLYPIFLLVVIGIDFSSG